MERIYTKICFAGEGGVGKTTIARKLSAVSTGQEGMTIGIDFHVVRIPMDDMVLDILVFDLGGQQQFRDILWDFFAGAECIVLTYDISRPSTATALEKWLEVLYPFKDMIIIVGNKIDLPRRVNGTTIKALIRKYGIKRHIETSALTGEGLDELLRNILEVLIEQKKAQLTVTT